MIRGIDHIAIAVEDLDAALELFARVFGLKCTHKETIAHYGVRVATIETSGTAIELVQGMSPDSPIVKFIAARGPGLHHVAFEVDDIDAALVSLRTRGVELIDASPHPGKQGSRVAFLHPRSTGRALVELVQRAADRRRRLKPGRGAARESRAGKRSRTPTRG